MERKVAKLICVLYTNELPSRHLITALDGKTVLDNRLSRPMEKPVPTVLDLPVWSRRGH